MYQSIFACVVDIKLEKETFWWTNKKKTVYKKEWCNIGLMILKNLYILYIFFVFLWEDIMIGNNLSIENM